MSNQSKKVIVKRKGGQQTPKKKKGKKRSTWVKTAGQFEKIPAPVLSQQTVRQWERNLQKLPLGNRQGSGFGNAANKRRVVVSESEYIGEIAVANQPNFSVKPYYPVNPGQATTFPWLSTIAKQYEKYRFLKLVFEYKPEVTQFTANANTGKVIMMGDYDSADTPPASKQQMEDTVPHCDAMPYQSQKLALNPKEMHQESVAKFVRTGVPNGDIKTYDCANFYIATQGQTANMTIGELHVHYTVELSVPVLNSANTPPVNYHVSWYESSVAEVGFASGVAQPMLFTLALANGLGVVNNAGSFSLPTGNYLIDVSVNAAAGTVGDLIGLAFTIQKNGNNISDGPYTVHTNTTTTAIWSSFNAYQAIASTDIITVPTAITFSGGAVSALGVIRFTAV